LGCPNIHRARYFVSDYDPWRAFAPANPIQCLCCAAPRLDSYSLLSPLRFHPITLSTLLSNSTGLELKALSPSNCNKTSDPFQQHTREMQASGTFKDTGSLYPSSRFATPSRLQPSPGSSSDTATSQRYPELAQSRTSGITRPNMYVQDNSCGSSSGYRSESRMSYEESVNNDFDQPKPLSYPYDSFVKDMRSVEQQTISMPDLNVFIRPIIARSNTRQAARQPQGNTRPPQYPLRDPVFRTTSEGSVHHAYSVRQPTAEDFFRPQHPLPAPPIEEYDSDQDLPFLEPDSHEYFFSAPNTYRTGVQPQTSGLDFPTRHSTTANVIPHRVSGSKPAYKRSQYVLAGSSQSESEHQNTPRACQHNEQRYVLIGSWRLTEDLWNPAQRFQA
jgi:hypothetical protein